MKTTDMTTLDCFGRKRKTTYAILRDSQMKILQVGLKRVNQYKLFILGQDWDLYAYIYNVYIRYDLVLWSFPWMHHDHPVESIDYFYVNILIDSNCFRLEINTQRRWHEHNVQIELIKTIFISGKIRWSPVKHKTKTIRQKSNESITCDWTQIWYSVLNEWDICRPLCKCRSQIYTCNTISLILVFPLLCSLC